MSARHRSARSASAPVWVGLDLGTSGVRAVAVAARGTVVGRGQRALDSRRTASRHEQDPGDWWEAVGAACREALGAIVAPDVRGVATCGTSGTVLLVGGGGAPVTPALLYDDARAAAVARELGLSPSWGLPKLVWLLQHQGAAAAGARLAHPPDLVNRRLAGHEVATDSSHALKSGYDLLAERWTEAVIGAVPPDTLPDVVRPGSVLGSVCPAAADHTGLPPGTPIVAGMTDGCTAQIAAGTLRAGDWSSVLGTTLVLKGVCERPIGAPADVVYSHRAPDGEWLPGGASSCGGGALVAAFPGRDLDALTRRAVPHQATRVLAYPLVGRGERFPFRAPAAEPFVVGEPRDEGERFAALLNGLAFVERLCFDVLDGMGAPGAGELTFSGRAAGNRYLCQLRADVLGRGVRVVEQGESAFGSAILAASPGRRLAEVAEEMVRTAERFEPRPASTERLTEGYRALVGELGRRGWLAPDAAARALARSANPATGADRGTGGSPAAQERQGRVGSPSSPVTRARPPAGSPE